MTNATLHADAIVVGSGITGGWAAKELTERGLRVLMIEQGRLLEHGRDYLGEHAPPWKLPFGGYRDRKAEREFYPVQHHCYAFDASTRHYFVRDPEHPYLTPDGQRFLWIRNDVFGGRSLTWGRQAYRWSPIDFEANRQDGHGIDWPLRYDDLAPWYEHVERFIGVSGQPEGLDILPDGVFQKPMAMYPLERTIKARLQRKLPHLTLTMGRVAILTEPLPGRSPCHYCGPCPRGCSTGSYFSTQSSTLPAAQATGRLAIRTDAIVERVLFDPERGRASGVQFIDRNTRRRYTATADVIFLCASTLGSTRILLNSATDAFPNGLANSSGVLGHYLMDHPAALAGIGVFTDHLDRYFVGFRPTGTYIPRFQNLDAATRKTDYVRGFGIQGYMLRMNWHHMYNQKGIGRRYKETLRRPGPWVWALNAFGECLPRYRNQVRLRRDRPDPFGIPQLEIDFAWSDNELNMFQDMAVEAERILRAAGAIYIDTDVGRNEPGESIHEMGTARMGRDPKTSVLNEWCQSHDVPNLFVTDGSAMTSSACVNPSITYMALTARASAYAAKAWKRGAL